MRETFHGATGHVVTLTKDNATSVAHAVCDKCDWTLDGGFTQLESLRNSALDHADGIHSGHWYTR